MKSWQESVHDTISGVIGKGLSRFLKTDGSRPQQHEDPTSNSDSHASNPQSRRAQMPQDPKPKYLTKNVKNFTAFHDNAECDPIEIPSEDEDDPLNSEVSSLRSVRQPQRFPPRTTPRSREGFASRDEARLLGDFTSDDSGTVVIPDPMTLHKKSFVQNGYRPMNTLHEPRPGTRSYHIAYKTQSLRSQPNGATSSAQDDFRANDHLRPAKRRKTQNPREERQSTTTAILLDNSQLTEDSPDELQITPEKKVERTPGILRTRYGSEDGGNGSLNVPGGYARESQRLVSEMDQSSPEDEGHFTKASAKQRRAKMDGMLRSSSPRPSELKNSAVASSPYFSKAGAASAPRPNGKAQIRTRELQQESPDALQSDEVQSSRPPKSHANMDAKQLIGPLIAATKRSTPVSRPETSRATGQNQSNCWNLQEIVGFNLPAQSIYTVQVDGRTKNILINTNIEALGSEPLFQQSLEKLFEIRYADECDIVSLEFSRSSDHIPARLYLRFESEKPVWEFNTVLQRLSVHHRSTIKTAKWMKDAITMARQGHSGNVRPGHISLQSQTSKAHSTKTSTLIPSTRANSGEKRNRLVDRLDAAPSTPAPRTIISGIERSGLQRIENRHSRSTDPGSSRNSSMKKAAPGSLPTRRVTRSQEQNESLTDEDVLIESRPKPKLSEREVLGEPWKNDLVYPVSDKKVAVVPFEDLRRLNDDEYLNDNLISFFVQYLEAYLEKTKTDAWRRIYFFNSYFFDTLTRTPKGKKGINYGGVSKWTKNLNLFKRDFVVVPVNENYHWYLAIICNLQCFLPEAEREVGTPSAHVDEDDTFAEQNDQRPQSHAEETQKSLAELSISDSETAQQNKTPSKKGRSRRKPPRLRKYETDKPVIITLDSLGTQRSATCSILKQYIAAEAQNKLGLDIDVGRIQGMTAKEIPTQSNFSDCGLYLCMYLEQFVTDPDRFVYRILQRVESTQQWPQKVHSHELRSRLRDLLLELHRRQEKEVSKTAIPEVGGIMIDKKEPPPEQTASQPPLTKEAIGAARSRFQDMVDKPNTTNSDNVERSRDKFNDSAGINEKHLDTAGDYAEGQSHAHVREQPISLSKAGATSKPEEYQDVRGTLTSSTPAELAAHLREQSHERQSRKKQRVNDSRRKQSRSASASTDFLTGPDSYIDPGRSLSPRSEGRRTTSRDSPDPEVIATRQVSNFEATHGRRKRKRYSAEPRDKAEQWTAKFDVTTEIPETQDSTTLGEDVEPPIRKKQALEFAVLEDLEAEEAKAGVKGPSSGEEDEMLV